MKVVFHPEAEKELDVTVSYYEKIDRNLGYDFASEVYFAIIYTSYNEFASLS